MTLQLVDILEGGPLGAEVGRGALTSDTAGAVHEHSAVRQQCGLRIQPGAQLIEAAQMGV